MNKQECDILNTILSEPYISQRALAEESGHCVGVVNRSIKNLKKEGYLDEQVRLTGKAIHVFRERAPRNAVILADGLGMRMEPDNVETPKGLLKVRGETLIERTIRQLHEIGIREIYVVVGFRKEQYEYLIDAYGVKLVVNPDYASKGTLYSLSSVLPYLSNTYVIPCDVWCGPNPYRSQELYSWYMVGDSEADVSRVRVNRKMELVSVPGQTGGNAVVGIAYLLEEQADALKERIMRFCKGNGYGSCGGIEGYVGSDGEEESQGHIGYDKSEEGEEREWPVGYEGTAEWEELELHKRNGEDEGSRGLEEPERRRRYKGDEGKAWESALYEKDRMIIPARVVQGTDAVRIYTLEQLRRFDSSSGRLKADALALSRRFLGGRPDEFVDMTELKKSTKNPVFLFSAKGKKYILQMPGEDTNKLVNSSQVAQVYASISGKGICDDPAYIDPENGCRITSFLEGVRNCNPMDVRDLEKCMTFLRHFHEMELVVEHEVDLFKMIAFYEHLWDGKQSLYKDYAETKENVLSLKSYIDSQRMQKCLTHMDAVPDKFLFGGRMDGDERGLSDRDEGEELRLVGWEHAGMQDPHVDLAMFCTDSLYDKEWVDRLISIYFGGVCPDGTRIKIYCYIAICGLFRSNWCEYRMKQGEEFGEYSLRQYRYAKEYYRVVKEKLSFRW